MGDEDIRRLGQATLDYLDWLSSTEKLKKNRLRERYGYILIEFLIFAVGEEIAWKDMFTLDTLRAFQKHFVGLKGAGPALISLSRYLYEEGRIAEPLEIPKYQVKLPASMGGRRFKTALEGKVQQAILSIYNPMGRAAAGCVGIE